VSSSGPASTVVFDAMLQAITQPDAESRSGAASSSPEPKTSTAESPRRSATPYSPSATHIPNTPRIETCPKPVRCASLLARSSAGGPVSSKHLLFASIAQHMAPSRWRPGAPSRADRAIRSPPRRSNVSPRPLIACARATRSIARSATPRGYPSPRSAQIPSRTISPMDTERFIDSPRDCSVTSLTEQDRSSRRRSPRQPLPAAASPGRTPRGHIER